MGFLSTTSTTEESCDSVGLLVMTLRKEYDINDPRDAWKKFVVRVQLHNSLLFIARDLTQSFFWKLVCRSLCLWPAESSCLGGSTASVFE